MRKDQVLFLEANNGQARLSVCLFGFECHVYNQAQVYETLENLVDQKESVISRGIVIYSNFL